ncbi:hypothetical protein PITCH_A2030165 [uncultured Desulfobacterium sp.]|uniref:Uncharacterized protein n=1 Tax=uncultured Desulfobacterium sp. TaxID=201089 RepID=A0A445MXE2_9BACT|nr:hypothetical protein PITCH_A2030165 [uncultured Desulfobacterium sp.]
MQKAEEIRRDIRIWFYVRDTGIGIAWDKQGKIMEGFSPVDRSTTKQPKCMILLVASSEDG